MYAFNGTEPELSDDELATAYATPAERFLRVNFVTSIDGVVAVDGVSRPLSDDADRRVFRLLRTSCDAVLVGAGTARLENYQPLKLSPQQRSIRVAAGRAPDPELVVVSRSGGPDVDLAALLDDLAAHGLRQVLCEGGPHLLGGLLAIDAVDELCLTVAPMIVGEGPHLVAGLAPAIRRFALQHVIRSGDTLLLRYVRRRNSG